MLDRDIKSNIDASSRYAIQHSEEEIEDFSGNNDASLLNIFTLKSIQPETVPIRDVNNKTLFG